MSFTASLTLVSMLSTVLATIDSTDFTESITSILKSSTRPVASHVLLNLPLFASVMMHSRFIVSVTTLLSRLCVRASCHPSRPSSAQHLDLLSSCQCLLLHPTLITSVTFLLWLLDKHTARPTISSPSVHCCSTTHTHPTSWTPSGCNSLTPSSPTSLKPRLHFPCALFVRTSSTVLATSNRSVLLPSCLRCLSHGPDSPLGNLP